LGWLKFGCKFSSKWLSFGCHSTLWRKYPSWQASIDDHATFLKRNPRYKACFACTTAQAFAKTLAQAGYATDPAYADKVIGLIKQHNLLSLDGGAA